LHVFFLDEEIHQDAVTAARFKQPSRQQQEWFLEN
jgi:hypothetical protein